MNTATRRRDDVDELLSTVAHELGTPIAVVRGYLQLLQDEGDDPDLRRDAIGAIRRNLDVVDRLILRFRDLRRLENGGLDLDLEPVDLGDLAREVVADMRDNVLARTPTRVQVDGGVAVHADPSRLRQVLFNLLSNAAAYSPDGAEVIVMVRRRRATAELVVRNHGFGIAPEDAERIFDKFTRATDRGGGTGLGLYISREVARAHGGDLTAEPAEVRGTRFTLRLPTA